MSHFLDYLAQTPLAHVTDAMFTQTYTSDKLCSVAVKPTRAFINMMIVMIVVQQCVDPLCRTFIQVISLLQLYFYA